MTNVIISDAKESDRVRLFKTLEFRVFLKCVKNPSLAKFRLIAKLFWLLNIDPKLIGGKQLFANLLALFQSTEFGLSNDVLQPELKKYVVFWIGFLEEILSNAQEICQVLPGFDPAPEEYLDHPMRGVGITRHPVAAALWVRHSLSPVSYPPDPANRPAMVFFRLQLHFLLCQLRSRFTTRFAAFRQHAAKSEHAPLSPLTATIGEALRVLSDSNWDTLTASFLTEQKTTVFIKNISHTTLKQSALAQLNKHKAKKLFDRVKIHFKGMHREFARGREKRCVGSRTDSSERDHMKIPGAYAISTHIFVHPPENDNDEGDDIVDHGADVIHISNDQTADVDAVRSGLAPLENKISTIKLYNPQQIGGAIQRARQQSLALEMSQQPILFGYQYLSNFEMSRIEFLLNKTIATEKVKKFNKDSEEKISAALILKIIRNFGLSIESAISLVLINEDEVAPSDGISLRRGGTPEQPLYAWILPVPGPSYSLDDNWDQAHGMERSEELILPDIFELGREIEDFVRQKKGLARKVFSVNLKSANRITSMVLKSLNDSRFTVAKLRKTIQSHVLMFSQDPVVQWILTADRSNMSSSRMYYARYPVNILVNFYQKVANSILTSIGKSTSVHTPAPSLSELWAGPSIGARFVMKDDAIVSLVSTLADRLKKLPANAPADEVANYHNDYMLYATLLQFLSTSHRAVNNPMELYSKWLADSEQWTVLADKDTDYSEHARLCILPEPLIVQFELLKQHFESMRDFFPSADRMKISEPTFFYIDRNRKCQLITEAWVEESYARLGFKIPANFHRAYARFALVKRGCPIEIVDAYLGHASFGESTAGDRSTFSHARHAAVLRTHIGHILRSTGLKPLASQLSV